MAATFTISQARWTLRKLNAFLAEWASRAPVPIVTQRPWTRQVPGPWTWLFPEGGIRGCSLLLMPGLVQSRGLQVRLNLMASRADWMLAHSLLRALTDTGNGTLLDADEQPMRAEQLREPEAGVEALAHLRADASRVVKPLREGRPYAALPTPEFTLFVTKELLPKESDETRFAMALEDELAAIAARYATAERVPVIELPDGSALSVWSQDAALLFLTHHVGVRRGENSSDGLVLPGPTLIEALGDRVEIVSEDHDRFYLPALDPSQPQDAKLLERLLEEGEPLDEWVARLGGTEAGSALYGTRNPAGTSR